jgi:hypothetical protein
VLRVGEKGCRSAQRESEDEDGGGEEGVEFHRMVRGH